MKKKNVTKKKMPTASARGNAVEAEPMTRPNASVRTNTLQRHGQTITVCFNGRRPGPSVKMLFDDEELAALGKPAAD